jgi:response regulator RpfG family c-di-GMP phosphodiesterase
VGGDLTVAIDAADNGLYAAKRRGRNRVFAGDGLLERVGSDEELEAIRLAEGLANAISIRAAIPPQECAVVADLASRIAAEVGLDADGVLRCRLAGWLHDIGTLAVPDDVLRAAAEGRLDDAGRAALGRQAEVGADFIAGMPTLAAAADAVRHHRDRFDGGGDRPRLRGEAIPIEARIVAVAVTYVQLARGPRAAVEPAAVRTALEAAAGGALDPTLVQAALRLLPGGALAA